jgi:hypothetical protein
MVMNLYLLENTFDYKTNHVKFTWRNKKNDRQFIGQNDEVWISFSVRAL